MRALCAQHLGECGLFWAPARVESGLLPHLGCAAAEAATPGRSDGVVWVAQCGKRVFDSRKAPADAAQLLTVRVQKRDKMMWIKPSSRSAQYLDQCDLVTPLIQAP